MILQRWVFILWRNVDNDSADVTSAGRLFQIYGLTTGKVNNLTDGMAQPTKQLVPADWQSDEMDGQAGRVRARLAKLEWKS